MHLARSKDLVLSVSEFSEHEFRKRIIHLSDGNEIFYEIPESNSLPHIVVYDFAVLATIFLCMRQGINLYVDGPVTSQLLINLEEFQDIWVAWKPKLYRKVAITAKDIVPTGSNPDRRGVFAFSGGVDGTCSLIRHADTRLGLRRIAPQAAVLVHGFDIPLDHDVAFDTAYQGGVTMLAELGVPLYPVRTNWRDFTHDYEMEFGAGLAACLHQFTGAAEFGVLGAGEDYRTIAVPWGSNPVTDRYLSGGCFEIYTDGGGLTRSERVSVIAEHPAIAAHLRVCWEGPQTGRNCGKCEKCTRTKLNFMAGGHRPMCFDGPPSVKDILLIKAKKRNQLLHLEEIVAMAEKNGIKDKWLFYLRLAKLKAKVRYFLKNIYRGIVPVRTKSV